MIHDTVNRTRAWKIGGRPNANVSSTLVDARTHHEQLSH